MDSIIRCPHLSVLKLSLFLSLSLFYSLSLSHTYVSDILKMFKNNQGNV